MKEAMRSYSLWIVGVLVGCRAQPAPSPAAVVACAVPVHEADSVTWREVPAEGFAFCVPGAWRPSGARGWRGEAGSVTWDLGEYRSREIGASLGMARVPAISVNPPRPPVSHRTTETIGGATATLWDTEFQGAHYTGANWEQPTIHFEGRAGGPRNAERQWAIYRTVHFSTPTGGK
ncbi:MAG: hypothetical protein HOQ09_10175 [Gemmatimonadaceae bacterium]|nr:hypothetical protein [Gemmatimonadaceae bacterium]